MVSEPFGRPLTLKQVAHALGCSERTVRRIVTERKFPPPRYTPGGKPVWFEKDVETYLYNLGRGLFETGEVPQVPEDEE